MSVRTKSAAGKSDRTFTPFSKEPCPACGHRGGWCTQADNGTIFCHREPKGAVWVGVDKNGSPLYVHAPPADDDGEPAPGTKARPKARGPRVEPAPVETRDAVYRDLLGRLTLALRHQDELKRRGLSDDAIGRHGYKTLPDARDYRARRGLLDALAGTWGAETLLSVPGFARDKNDALTIAALPGLLVPALDSAGRVVALLVKPDRVMVGKKYLWLSSASRGGPGSGAPCHDSGDVGRAGDGSVVRLTEGALKADVAAELSGVRTLGAAGVTNWRPALPMLWELGPKTVLVAFDQDATTNALVAYATDGCCRALRAEGYDVAIERWDWAHAKGIDDALAGWHPVEVLAGDQVDAYLAGLLAGHEPPPGTPPPEANGRADHGGPEPPADDRDGRPVITITPDLHVTVDRSAAAIAGHRDVFSRAGALVQVVRHPGSKPDAKGLKRPAGAPIIAEMGEATARTMLSRVARYQGWDVRAKDFVRKAPPRDIAEAVLGLKVYPDARELAGIIEAPTLRPDGSLLCKPGFDAATGLLYLPNAEYPEILDRPTRDDARDAVKALLYPVQDFPFETHSDRAAWVAAALTAVARCAIDGPVPHYLLSANIAGTGKSWLTTIVGTLAAGRPPAFDGYAEQDEEMEKRLTAVAIVGDRVIVFDNARNGAAVGGPALDRAATARGAFRGRILGTSRMSPDVPWVATVFITGNNLGTRDDSLRRFVPIFLYSETEHPEERRDDAFAVYRETGLTLGRYVEENRPRLVAAALTVVRAFVVADRPRADLTPVDFPEWSNLIRQAVYFATGVDPCGSRPRLAADDETSSERERIVGAWADLCTALDQPDGLTTSEAAGALDDFRKEGRHPELLNAFAHFARRGAHLPNSKDLGYLLKRHRKAPTSQGRLESGDTRKGQQRWVVHSPAPRHAADDADDADDVSTKAARDVSVATFVAGGLATKGELTNLAGSAETSSASSASSALDDGWEEFEV
jgi:putative DNA primase/helicase